MPNQSFNPIDIGLLGAQAPDLDVHLVKQSWFPWRG
jgi:hypothetical protein